MTSIRSAMLACAAIASTLLSAPANATYCTNGATNYPKCNNQTPPPAPATAPQPNTSSSKSDSSSTSGSAANAGAAAGAKAGSKATGGNAAATGGKSSSKAAGGAGGAGGTATSAGGAGGAAGDSQAASDSSSSLSGIGNSTDQSSSSFRALAISLPTPVFTPPLPMDTSECAETTQSARGVLFNGFTMADAARTTDKCTLIRLHNAYLSECQYASAKQVKDLLTVKLLPDFKVNKRVAIDLSEGECAALKAPVVEKKVDTINFVYTPPDLSVPAVKVPKVKPRNAVAKKVVSKAVEPMCPTGQAQQCVAKK